LGPQFEASGLRGCCRGGLTTRRAGYVLRCRAAFFGEVEPPFRSAWGTGQGD
jgi:hypothetical protein